MNIKKKLPESEFEIMKIIWENEPPITTSIILNNLSSDKAWKAATIISFLNRLVSKGFLSTEKTSKERLYYPLITKKEYLEFETKNFIKQYHKNSFLSFVNTLYDGEDLDNEELDKILEWAKEKRK